MRKILSLLILAVAISLFVYCGDDATQPPSVANDGTVHGQIKDTAFEYEINGGEPGDPTAGPFLLRGSNVHYNDEDGALVVNLTVLNRGSVTQHEPIGLTFIRIDPDGVTVLNPDNDVHDDGAAIVFHFENDDNLWTPGEASLPRTVEFGVDKGASIAFIARLDIGAPVDGGAIAGRVWNDANKDGVMQDTEGGLPNVGVYLYPFTGDDNTTPKPEFGFTPTDGEGHYAFHHLPAGGYVVSIAPSTTTLLPTTPTEIHVVLVQTDDGVSSYRGANFGAVGPIMPPPTSDHVHATGLFYPRDVLYAMTLERFLCPNDSIPPPVTTDLPVNDDCIGGRLRGAITEIAPERNSFRVMATWMFAINGIPGDLKVGSRVDVHVQQGPGPLAWVADAIAPWNGPGDEIIGRVDAAETEPNGSVRLRVLDTWITTTKPKDGK
jgi:hypothetical protein